MKLSELTPACDVDFAPTDADGFDTTRIWTDRDGGLWWADDLGPDDRTPFAHLADDPDPHLAHAVGEGPDALDPAEQLREHLLRRRNLQLGRTGTATDIDARIDEAVATVAEDGPSRSAPRRTRK